MSQFYSASIPLTDYPLNSKGHSFSTVQACIDDLAGGGWVFVPSGTWSEAVTISDDDVVLFGAGWSSHISGGTTGTAITLTGARCTIRDLQLSTTAAGGNSYNGITSTSGDYNRFIRVYISACDNHGIDPGQYGLTLGCKIAACDGYGIIVNRIKHRIIACYIDDTAYLYSSGDDSIMMGCYVSGAVTIHADGENCVVDGNRLDSNITDNSGTSTVGDNDTT